VSKSDTLLTIFSYCDSYKRPIINTVHDEGLNSLRDSKFLNLLLFILLPLTAVSSIVILSLYPGRMFGSALTSSRPICTAGSWPSPPAHGPRSGNSPINQMSFKFPELSIVVELPSTSVSLKRVEIFERSELNWALVGVSGLSVECRGGR